MRAGRAPQAKDLSLEPQRFTNEFLRSLHPAQRGADHGRNGERNGMSVRVPIQNWTIDYQHVTREFLERTRIPGLGWPRVRLLMSAATGALTI